MNEFTQLYHIIQTFEEVLIGQKANPSNDKQYRRLKKVIKWTQSMFLLSFILENEIT